MQIGNVTIDGFSIGTIEIDLSDEINALPDFEGYIPSGRAEDGLGGGGLPTGHIHGPGHHHLGHHEKNKHHFPGHRPEHPQNDVAHDSQFDSDIPEHHRAAPEGRTYDSGPGSRTFPQGSAETDAAIVRAAREHNLDPNFMRGIASIESGMNPSSNANRPTQYKGLYQIGHNEWQRTGQGGNIYSAADNAQAGARLFSENNRQFRQHFGRDATETELYMMHQQGLGFYTNNAMTNIRGNPYPGMSGPQTHESFEAGWGREVARRKAAFARTHPTPTADAPPAAPMPTQTEPM